MRLIGIAAMFLAALALFTAHSTERTAVGDGAILARVDLSRSSWHYKDATSDVFIWDYFSPDGFAGLRKVRVEIDDLSIARESRVFLKLHDASGEAPAGIDPLRLYRYVSLGIIDTASLDTLHKPDLDTNGAAVDKLHDRIALQDNPTQKGANSAVTFDLLDPTSDKHPKQVSFKVQSSDNIGRMTWDRGIASYARDAPLTGFRFIASGPMSGTAVIVGYRK